MVQDLRILIIENNNDYRSFLSKVIANIDGAEISDAVSTGRHAIARLKQMPADLVLLQMETPAMEGLQTLEKLRESCPETDVIAISASNSENPEDAANAVQLGALDYISGFGMDLSEDGALSLRRRLLTLIGLYRARRNSRLAKQLHQEHLPAPCLNRRRRRSHSNGPAEMGRQISQINRNQSENRVARNRRIDRRAKRP